MEKNYFNNDKELTFHFNFSKNKDIDLDKLTLGSKEKICQKCDNGHECKTTIGNRTDGNKCSYCLHKKLLSGFI